MPASRPRLGVLGGSFDPPHLGHLVVASEAWHALGLEAVLFVPAAAPPHKAGTARTPAALRLEMARAAVAGDPRFRVSDIEVARGLVYTCDLLAALAEGQPGRDLVFIMGADSLLQLETWHQPERVVALAHLAVAPRQGCDPVAVAAVRERWGAGRVTLLDAPLIGVSSSEVRARVAAGRPVDYLVPAAVARLIAGHGLYR